MEGICYTLFPHAANLNFRLLHILCFSTKIHNTCVFFRLQKCLHFVICYDFVIPTYSETIFLSNNSAVDILGNVNNNRISLSGIPTSLFWGLPEKGIKSWFSKHIKKLAAYDFFCCDNNGTSWIEIHILTWPWNLCWMVEYYTECFIIYKIFLFYLYLS